MAHRVSRQRRRRGSLHDGETATIAARAASPAAEEIVAPVALMRPNAGHDFARMAQTAQTAVSREKVGQASLGDLMGGGGTLGDIMDGPLKALVHEAPKDAGAAPAKFKSQTAMLHTMFNASVVSPLSAAYTRLDAPHPDIDGALSNMTSASQMCQTIGIQARSTGDEAQALRAIDLSNRIDAQASLLVLHRGLTPVHKIAQEENPDQGAVSECIRQIELGFDNPTQTVPTTGNA